MCGRFGLTRSPWVLARKLGADPTGCDFTPRYNIAPTQRLLAVINEAAPALTKLRWGLVPAWSDGHDAVQLSTFNARIETAATARTYRNAFHELHNRDATTQFIRGEDALADAGRARRRPGAGMA